MQPLWSLSQAVLQYFNSALLYICRAAHAAGLCRVGGVWFDGPKQGMHSTVLFLIAERHGIKIHESEPSRDKVLNIHY